MLPCMEINATLQDKLKRKRTSPEGDDNDEGKKRGRPRVDPQAQSAADRRRTQIRLAQRAYRQRKESTLDELRKQVTDLQDTIKSMNQAFQGFREKWVSQESMVPLHLVDAMRQVSNQYSALVNVANEGNQASPPSPSSSSSVSEVEKRLSVVSAVPVDRHSPGENGSRRSVTTTNVWGYSLVDPEHQTSCQPPQYNTQYNNHPHSTTNSMMNILSTSASRPLSKNMTLSPPFTYSFQETTFARRLHRASVELAYRLSCDSSRNPSKFDKVFQLWLKWVPNIKVVQDQLRAVLFKGTTDPLSLWHFPLSHIGGAGTHYPRREVHSESWRAKPSPEDWNVRLTSAPSIVPGTDEAIGYDCQHAMLDVIAHHPEYQGEWFDAYDVEGYLAERGITIDPQSSFADVELPVSEIFESEQAEMRRNPSAMICTRISSSSSASSISTANSMNGSEATRASSINTATTTPSAFDPFDNSFGAYSNTSLLGSGVGYSDTATGSFMNLLPSHTAQPYISGRSTAAFSDFGLGSMYNNGIYQNAQVPRTRTVTIDVAKLILMVARSALCLGRAPGYRRRNIDNAIKECIMHDI